MTPVPTVLEYLINVSDEEATALGRDTVEFAEIAKADCASGYFQVIVNDEGVTFATEVNEASLVTPDMELCGGIVHSIDTVLLPNCEINEDDITVAVAVADPPIDDAPELIVVGAYGGYGRK